MADTYAGFASLISQPDKWADITPGDTPFAVLPKALWCTVAGNLDLVGSDGVQVTFPVVAGLVPLRPTIIKATSTATVKALY